VTECDAIHSIYLFVFDPIILSRLIKVNMMSVF